MRITPLLLLAVVASIAHAHETLIDGRMHHLRGGSDVREWAEFPEKAEGQSLTVDFDAQPNAAEQTLWLRQIDVKQRWQMKLNGKPLADLPTDENDTAIAWPVKPGMLVAGKNTLSISMLKGKANVSDDVRVGQIRLDDEPAERVINAGKLEVRVTDAAGEPVPCRITIVDQNGSLVSLGAKSNDHLAVREGVIYALSGQAETGLAPGVYTVYANRGFEWSVAKTQVIVGAGEAKRIDLKIRREVDTTGLVACDTHLHTFTHSRHGDATMTERQIVNAGEGIELPVATDHNLIIDYNDEAKRINARRWFTPVVGDEVTTRVGHFNVFPLNPSGKKPDEKLPTWPAIIDSIKSAGAQVIILNHPRDLQGNYRPFDPSIYNWTVAEHATGWTFGNNAMELVNSGALQSDPMRLYHDWFAILNAGYNVAGIGSSDSHDVTRHIPGQGRTYLRCDDRNVADLNIADAITAIQDGSSMVSMGLLTEITLDGKHTPGKLAPARGEMQVNVRVLGPSWTTVSDVELYVNGTRVKHATVNRTSGGDKPGGEKWSETWILPKPPHDVFLVAVARGPGVTEPFWKIPKSYQPTTPEWKPYVIGSSGVLRVDADGDGKWTSAREYADQLVAKFGDDLPRLFDAMRGRDRAAACHVAKLLGKRGLRPKSEPLAKLLAGAADHVKEAFAMYWAAQEQMEASMNP